MGALEAKLIKELTPLYEQLVENVKQYDNVSGFIPHYGFEYENSANPKILYVGKATNGWGDGPNLDYKEWLKINSSTRCNNLRWVKKCEGNNSCSYCENESNFNYNTRKSAFWRVIKRLSMEYFQVDKTIDDSSGSWYEKIAWTNLYKIAPFDGGNPKNAIINAQQEACIQIFQKELEILNPDVVILFTSEWENKFKEKLYELFQNKEQPIKFGAKGYKIYPHIWDNTLILRSVHPQGKPENDHVCFLDKAIKKHVGMDYGNC